MLHVMICFLLNFDSLRSHLKVYNHDLKAVNDAPVDTPWPLIWMLVRYSRPHIWCSKKQLDLKPFHQAVLSFGNNMRWSCFFRNEESRTLPFRVPHVVTAQCRVVIDAAFEAWLAKFQRAATMKLQLAISK